MGEAAGPMLRIDSNGTGEGATAWTSRWNPVRSPDRELEAGKATNRDANKIDGKDSAQLPPIFTWQIDKSWTGGSANQRNSVHLSCDQGDRLLSGGYRGADPGTHVDTNRGSF